MNFLKPNWSSRTITFDKHDAQVSIPARVEVCGRCGGTGTHDPAEFAGGFSADDFAEDPEFREDYWSGVYDVRCEECGGRNVTLTVDWETAERTMPEVVRELEGYMRAEAEIQADIAAERRAGC